MTFPPDQPLPVEVSLLSLRRHGRHLVLPALVLVAVTTATGYWVGALPEPWMNWLVGIGALVIALVLGLGPILSWMTHRTTVTNRRVIQRTGFFVHHRTEVPLSRVRAVQSSRGPIQRLFGSGDVQLLVGADEPTVLQDVPGCAAVVDALQELIESNFALHTAQYTGGAHSAAAPVAPGHADETRILPGL